MTRVNEGHGRHSMGGATGTEEALFGGPAQQMHGGLDFVRIGQEPAFVSLRSKQRRFVFPLSVLFMAWYMTFVLLAAYAHDFMSRPELGLINVGMLLGLAQFVTTVLIMLAYCRYARTTLDPATERVRELEEGRA